MSTPENTPAPVPADTAPEHLEAIVTSDAVLELPPEKSGFGEGNVGEVLLDLAGLTKSFGSNNPTNLVKAAMDALQQLRTQHEVERLRGVTLS